MPNYSLTDCSVLVGYGSHSSVMHWVQSNGRVSYCMIDCLLLYSTTWMPANAADYTSPTLVRPT